MRLYPGQGILELGGGAAVRRGVGGVLQRSALPGAIDDFTPLDRIAGRARGGGFAERDRRLDAARQLRRAARAASQAAV